MLAGLLAGLLAFAFAFVFGEPEIQRAVDFETLVAARAGEAPEPEVFGRGAQRTAGLLTGAVVVGIGLGGLFALVFAYAYGRLRAGGPRGTAAVLAAAGFATVVLVPFTKYPANPPAVGDPATLDERTLLYFTMVAISALALVAAFRIRGQSKARLGGWNATIAAGGLFLLVVAAAQVALPPAGAVPGGFPADVLYRFRLASLGVGATMWLTLGLVFGAAAERLIGRRPGTVPAFAS